MIALTQLIGRSRIRKLDLNHCTMCKATVTSVLKYLNKAKYLRELDVSLCHPIDKTLIYACTSIKTLCYLSIMRYGNIPGDDHKSFLGQLFDEWKNEQFTFIRIKGEREFPCGIY